MAMGYAVTDCVSGHPIEHCRLHLLLMRSD